MGERLDRRPDAEYEAAFRELYPKARRLAARIVRELAVAEEVAADALSRAYDHWESIGSLPHRDAWVMRVTLNLALNVVRRRSVVPHVHDPEPLEDGVAARLDLAAALATLPPRQREVVVLRHVADMSEVEIGAWLGVTHGTVKTHLRRGQQALRARYAGEVRAQGAAAEATVVRGPLLEQDRRAEDTSG